MTIKTTQNWKVSAYTRVTGANTEQTFTDVRQSRDFAWYRDGYENPNWQNQVMLGQNATTTMTAERKDLISVPGEYHIGYGFTPSVYAIQKTYGDYYGYKSSILSYVEEEYTSSTADNLAKAKFLANVKAQTQKFTGGVFLGELKETLRMIRRPAKSLFEGFATYRNAILRNKRMARGNRAKYLDSVRQTWLEFQFGVKPLIHDIRDGAAAYRELMEENEDLRENVRGVGRWKNVVSQYTDTDYGNAFLFTKEENRTSNDVLCIYRGATQTNISGAPSSAVSRVLDVVGLGPSDWLPTVWELIPFSFVVDYFSNVGDILASVTTRRDNLLWVSRTNIYTKSVLLTGSPDLAKVNATVSPIWELGSSGLGYALSLNVRVHRMPITDLLFYPTLEFKMPPVESLKWLNLAALVGGFRSIKP